MTRKLTSEQMKEFIRDVPAFVATVDALMEDRARNWRKLAKQSGYPYHRLWRYMRGHGTGEKKRVELLGLRDYIHLYCVMIGDPTPDLSLDVLRPDRISKNPQPRTPEGKAELAQKRQEQSAQADAALAIE